MYVYPPKFYCSSFPQLCETETTVSPPLKLCQENAQRLEAELGITTQTLPFPNFIGVKKVRKFTKWSIIQARILGFRSNFVQTLSTWHLMHYKCSRSTSQRSRSQCDITCQHQKIVTCHERIGWLSLNFVKIILERRATRDTCSRS